MELVQASLLASAEKAPDKVAIVDEYTSATYAELRDDALRFAQALQDAGLEHGDRVALYLDNTVDCAVAIFGVLLAGGAFTCVNPQTKAGKLAFILNDSGARFLVAESHSAQIADAAVAVSPRVVRTFTTGVVSTFREAIQRSAGEPAAPEVDPAELASLVYTSGTTGEPKGVMHSHAGLVFATATIAEYLRLDENDRILSILPIAFTYGLSQLLLTVHLRATLLLERSFTFPAKTLARLREEEATVFPAVPTVFATILAMSADSSFPSVRCLTNAAAGLPPALHEGLRRVFPNGLLYRMYGQTECIRVCYLEPDLIDAKPTSVGKAIPGTGAFVLDEDGSPVEPGEVGVLHVRGPHIMMGYWGAAELTAEKLVDGPDPGECTMSTLDHFTVDEDGDLYFVDRSDDIIKTRGEKVSSVEVENALHDVPGVRQAAVVGVPDELLGQAVRAYVLLDEDAQLTELDVIRECRTRLENFMVPQDVVFMTELPHTDSGKVRKKSLSRAASQATTDEDGRSVSNERDPRRGEAGLPGPGQSESSADAPAAPPPAPPEERPKMRRNVTVLAGSQLITWTMTLAWTLVVPRALGPSGLGTIMAAWSITGILGVVLGLGTRNYLVRESVVRPGSASGLIGTALVLRVVLSPLLIVGAIVYGQLVGWGHEAEIVLYLAAAATIFVQMAEPLQAGFQATERMEYLAYSDIISKSGQGLVGIVIVLLGFGTIGVTACWAVMTGVVVVLDLYWLRSLVRIDVRTNLQRMVSLAKASLPYWAFGVFFMLYLWIDFVMLSLLTTDEVVGWYAVPTRLFQTLMFLPVAVGTAWLPHFVRGFEEGDGKLREAARQPIELVLLLSLPIAALTAVEAGPVIHFLYGSDYANSVPVMAILGLCIPAMYMNIMLSQVLIAMNRQASWTWVMAVTTIVNPLFNLALIPLTQNRYGNGAIGAAISLLLTEIVVVAAGIWLIGRRVFDAGSGRRAALGLLAAAAAGGAAYFTQGVIGWVASIPIGVLAFALAAAILRVFTSAEIDLMRQGLMRLTGKLRLTGRTGSRPARQPS